MKLAATSFGEIEYSVEALVERIIEYMENGCRLKDEYRPGSTPPSHSTIKTTAGECTKRS